MKLTNNFSLNEFESNIPRRKGFPVIQVPLELMGNVRELANNLQIIRNHIDKPITITSGFRTEDYNKKVGGKPQSYHLRALAADMHVEGMKPSELHKVVLELAEEGFIKQGGIGIYDDFVHYDIRGFKARWDERSK
jgi:uncharacterized protein YcbK (DUF882 family)